MPTLPQKNFTGRLNYTFVVGLLVLGSFGRLVAGTKPDTVTVAETLSLPVKGEVTRSYSAGKVSVRMVSHPYFSSTAAGSPALEVGPASLTFMLDKKGGAVLLLGDTLLTLPSSIPLGADDRSKQPLDFTLSYDPTDSAANLTFEGKPFTVPAKVASSGANIVIAAGDQQSWQIDTLEVSSDSPVLPSIAASDNSGADLSDTSLDEPNPEAAAANRAKDFEDSRALFKAHDLIGAEKALVRSNRKKTDSVAGRIESAGKLIQMAFVLRQEYDYPGALAIAQRALVLLREVDKLVPKASVEERSEAHSMAAYIGIEILHDTTAARADYEQALQIDASSNRARDGVQQLDEADAKKIRVGSNRK